MKASTKTIILLENTLQMLQQYPELAYSTRTNKILSPIFIFSFIFFYICILENAKVKSKIDEKLSVTYNIVIGALEARWIARESCMHVQFDTNEHQLAFRHPFPANVTKWSRQYLDIMTEKTEKSFYCSIRVLRTTWRGASQ